MKVIRILILFLVFISSFVVPAAAEMKVLRATVCTGIEDREPIGQAESFSNVHKLYLFSEINDAEDTSSIKHIWYFGDKKMLEIELAVNGQRWRTWSYKNIYGVKGDWRAEVVAFSGEVLSTVSFTVQ